MPQGREGQATAVLSRDTVQLDGKEEVKRAWIAAGQGDTPYAAIAGHTLDRLVKDGG